MEIILSSDKSTCPNAANQTLSLVVSIDLSVLKIAALARHPIPNTTKLFS